MDQGTVGTQKSKEKQVNAIKKKTFSELNVTLDKKQKVFAGV